MRAIMEEGKVACSRKYVSLGIKSYLEDLKVETKDSQLLQLSSHAFVHPPVVKWEVPDTNWCFLFLTTNWLHASFVF